MTQTSVPRGLLVRLKPASTKPAEAFLSYADRCWRAEEANATRYASQTQMLTAVAIGLIAVVAAGATQLLAHIGLAGIARLATPVNHLAIGLVIVLFFGAMHSLYTALKDLHLGANKRDRLRRRSAVDDTARASRSSELFIMDAEYLDRAGRLLDEDSFTVFEQTYAAFLDLCGRNTLRGHEIENARGSIFSAVRWIFGILLVFSVCQLAVSLDTCGWLEKVLTQAFLLAGIL